MKIYLYLLIFICNYAYSQKSDFTGRVEYKMYLNLVNMKEYDSELLFNKTSSIFTYKELSNSKDVEYKESLFGTENQFILKDTITYQVVIDKTEKLLYDKRINFIEKKRYYSTENIPNLDWELFKEKKEINEIECSLAKTSFRGRNYYAWYAPSIANSFGPWKLYGLPGLIIEAYDENKDVIFYLKSINLPYKETIQVLDNNLSKITLLEHINILNNFESELQSKIQSKIGRGITLNVKTVRSDIELNFEDIYK